MKRSILTFAMLLLIAMIWSSSAKRAQAAFSLKVKQIKLSFKVSDQEDAGFIARAVIAVKSGRIPRDVFDSTFRWAVKKQTRRFQYFRRALIVRAAKLGVLLN